MASAQKVSEAMQKPSRSVQVTDTVADALAVMERWAVATLPVTAPAGRWRGLLMWRELDAARETPERQLDEFTHPEYALSPEDSLDLALARMNELRVGQLPVVDEGLLVGSLTRAAMRGDNRPRRRITGWRPATWTQPLRGEHAAPQATPRRAVGPGARPALEPALGAQIEAALDLLSSVPFEELQARGWHLQPNHYYWPLNDIRFLRENADLWDREQEPAEIDWNLDRQEQLAERLAGHFEELGDVRDGPSAEPGEFVWKNGAFPPRDACAYYGLVRELQPRRVVEIGAGWSSLMLARAERANGGPIDVTLVEPEPNPALLGVLPQHWRLEASFVQRAETALWRTLEPGDILFYDGSHCARTGSDVNWMLFEVLPQLRPGVWIHFHDIHWPGDYPREWVIDEGLTWNEQYLLQAFLMHNDSYAVRLAMRMLTRRRQAAMDELFPAIVAGGSVWLEKVRP